MKYEKGISRKEENVNVFTVKFNHRNGLVNLFCKECSFSYNTTLYTLLNIWYHTLSHSHNDTVWIGTVTIVSDSCSKNVILDFVVK